MNKLTYWSLAAALVMVLAYVAFAIRRGAKPELVSATHIAVATVGLGGAARLIGFVFFGDFTKAADASDHGWWSLAHEDAIFLVVGGLALAWASCQQIVAGFIELLKQPKVAPSAPPVQTQAAQSTPPTP